MADAHSQTIRIANAVTEKALGGKLTRLAKGALAVRAPAQFGERSFWFSVAVRWPDRVKQIAETNRASDQDIALAQGMLLDRARSVLGTLTKALDAEVAHFNGVAGQFDDEDQPIVRGLMLRSMAAELRGSEDMQSRPGQISERLHEAIEDAFEFASDGLAQEKAREGFRAASGVDNYAGLFPAARAIKRKLYYHAGPTNSGKTYHALKALMAAESGCYLAPLRLMALEGADRLNDGGVPCHLLTGEEHIEAEGARHVSSTIEMLDSITPVKVGIIDEAQMIEDRERGWAWTRAIVGLPAEVIYLTGSAEAVPYVRKIAEMCGDRLEVVEFTRLTPLEPLDEAVKLDQVKPGDAIVCFSRRSVFEIRESLQALQQSSAVIYGALGPEVRRAEARRFRSGEAAVLIATDAIGMGLNLPIRRVLLAEVKKYDGTEIRAINPPEVRQICGRAGRFSMTDATTGYAGVLAGNPPGVIGESFATPAKVARNVRLPAIPHWEMIEGAAEHLQHEDLAELMRWCSALFAPPLLKSADIANAVQIATTLAGLLPLKDRFNYLGCPVSTRSPAALATLRQWALEHHRGHVVPPPNPLPEGGVASSSNALQELESLAKDASMWLWLNMRWPAVYVDREAALAVRAQTSEAIERSLRSQWAKQREKRGPFRPKGPRGPAPEKTAKAGDGTGERAGERKFRPGGKKRRR